MKKKTLFESLPIKKNETFPGEEGNLGKGKKAKENTSGISYFDYSFDGSIGGNNYSYIVKKNNDTFIFSFNSMLYRYLEITELQISKDIIDQLNDACLKYKIAEWDGYSRYNKYVLDGESFSLYIKFNDGKSISASGHNAFPSNYSEFCNSIDLIFKPLKDEIIKSSPKIDY